MLVPINQVGARFEFSVELEAVTYGLSFRWNERAPGWFMDIKTGSGDVILSGVRVVINTMLLGRATDTRLPFGDFIALDTTDQELDAGFEDLGRRVKLQYYTRDELLAFMAAA